MSDLTDFLLARIAEDEESAYAWVEPPPGYRPLSDDDWRRTWAARVLAECEAKRRIVTREMSSVTGITYRRRMVLQDLAAVYADHPDYRDEWRQ